MKSLLAQRHGAKTIAADVLGDWSCSSFAVLCSFASLCGLGNEPTPFQGVPLVNSSLILFLQIHSDLLWEGIESNVDI